MKLVQCIACGRTVGAGRSPFGSATPVRFADDRRTAMQPAPIARWACQAHARAARRLAGLPAWQAVRQLRGEFETELARERTSDTCAD